MSTPATPEMVELQALMEEMRQEMEELAVSECLSCLGPTDGQSEPDRIALYLAIRHGDRLFFYGSYINRTVLGEGVLGHPGARERRQAGASALGVHGRLAYQRELGRGLDHPQAADDVGGDEDAHGGFVDARLGQDLEDLGEEE